MFKGLSSQEVGFRAAFDEFSAIGEARQEWTGAWADQGDTANEWQDSDPVGLPTIVTVCHSNGLPFPNLLGPVPKKQAKSTSRHNFMFHWPPCGDMEENPKLAEKLASTKKTLR